MKTYPEATPKILAHLKRTELKTLLTVDKACMSIGVDYFLDSDTLLGVVRHKGFTPWCDNIDIGMLRLDYGQFLVEGQVLLESNFSFKRQPQTKNPISVHESPKEWNTDARTSHEGSFKESRDLGGRFSVRSDRCRQIQFEENIWRETPSLQAALLLAF